MKFKFLESISTVVGIIGFLYILSFPGMHDIGLEQGIVYPIYHGWQNIVIGICLIGAAYIMGSIGANHESH